MSTFYTYAKQWGNQILYRGVSGGRRIVEKIPFKPTMYLSSPDSKGDVRSLYDNKPLEKIEFGSIKEAKNFIEQYKDVAGFEVHGFPKFEYQLINSRHKGDIEYDLNLLSIYAIDIETVGLKTDGFPDIQRANIPVVLISIHDLSNNRTTVFGLKDFKPELNDNFDYVYFESEEKLLRAFVRLTQTTQPDVWTGWNIDQFDIPYLVNRITNTLGEEEVKKLSPFGLIREKITNIRGKDVQSFEIFGIIILDYLELYRKYGTYSQKESYALGHIAQEELGVTKLELPGNSFFEAYTDHFPTFVRYNARDAVLVKMMDDKLKLIELAFAMAFMYHCNLQDIFKTVAPWEIFIYNFLDSKGIAVPPKREGMRGELEGAWVKVGNPDLYGWSMSFDFASLYPSIIRQWNISPEKFISNEFINAVTPDDFLSNTEKAQLAKAEAVAKNASIAANGTMYSKDSQGFLPALMEYCMVGRSKAKKEMLRLQNIYEQINQIISERTSSCK